MRATITPLFVFSHVGAGTDVAVDTADVAIVKKDLADMSRFIVLARKVQGKSRQNLSGRRSTT